MSLLPDWKDILKRAWSVKFMVLAALLSGIEVCMQILEPTITSGMPKGVFAGLAGVVTAAAIPIRLLAQKEAEYDAKK